MASLASWGNELYTGKRSYPFTGKRNLWFAISAVLVVLSILLALPRIWAIGASAVK